MSWIFNTVLAAAGTMLATAFILGGLASIDSFDALAWMDTEYKYPTVEICDRHRVPRPEKQTVWGPVSTGSDVVKTNCRMVDLNER